MRDDVYWEGRRKVGKPWVIVGERDAEAWKRRHVNESGMNMEDGVHEAERMRLGMGPDYPG
jgi:hypothetical protein